jgi:hypothetical protein
VLTLLVTPSALMLRANLAAWWQRRRDKSQPPAEPAPVQPLSLSEAAE